MKRCCDMSRVSQPIDLTQVPAVPWAWVDEHIYATIRGCSVKVLQHERRLNIGCPFRRINGTTIRYKLGDVTAFLESQPGGGGGEEPINPKNEVQRERCVQGFETTGEWNQTLRTNQSRARSTPCCRMSG